MDSQVDTKCIEHCENYSTLIFLKISTLLHMTWSTNVASNTSICLKKVTEKLDPPGYKCYYQTFDIQLNMKKNAWFILVCAVIMHEISVTVHANNKRENLHMHIACQQT